MTRRGPIPAPRYQLDETFRAAIRACGRPRWVLSTLSGFPDTYQLSAILWRRSVPATPQNIERLERLADIVGYPRDRIFA